MKRREFLILLLGAAVCVPVVKVVSTAAPTAALSKPEMLAEIYTRLAETALDYVNGTEDDRRMIIEDLNNLIAGLLSDKTRSAMTEYRTMLLNYSAKTEVAK